MDICGNSFCRDARRTVTLVGIFVETSVETSVEMLSVETFIETHFVKMFVETLSVETSV